jgi:hypothetical protein
LLPILITDIDREFELICVGVPPKPVHIPPSKSGSQPGVRVPMEESEDFLGACKIKQKSNVLNLF